MDLNKDNMKKIMQLIVFTVLLIAGLFHIDVVVFGLKIILGILSPFLIGATIAFVLNLPMRAIEKNLFPEKANQKKAVARLKRPVSLILAILLLIGIVAIVLLVVVPELVNTMSVLVVNAEAFVPKAQHYLEILFQNNAQITQWMNEHPFDWNMLVTYVTDFMQNGFGNVLSGTISTVVSVISGVVDFFIGFVFACYILMQKEKLEQQSKRLLKAMLPERRYRDTLYVCSLCHKTFSGFITGQCMDAAILGLMFVIAMTLFRLPYAFLMGVLIAFTALIPVFGAFIGCVVGILLILMVNPFQAIIFLILFLVLQQLEEHFVYPHVVGNSVGLPSIWVMVAVVLGGSLMGVLGMLVFIPIVSVLYTLLRRWVRQRLRKKAKSGEEDTDINLTES